MSLDRGQNFIDLTEGVKMIIGTKSEFYIGDKKFDGYLKSWQMEESLNDLTQCRLNFVLTDRVINNKQEQKHKDLYPLVWLGIGIIVFCMIWSI